MKIGDFETIATKSLRQAVNYLNRNKRKLEQSYSSKFDFDFPDYFNMPKSISNRLKSEHVDWIQEQLGSWTFTNPDRKID